MKVATNRGRIGKTLGFAGALAVALLAGSTIQAEEGVARLDGWIAPSASTRLDGFLKIRWTGETDERDLAAYSRLTREKGERALRSELADKNLGRFSVDGEIGLPIAIVRETRDEGMTRLLVVVPRDISPLELFRKNDSHRYPYLVFDAILDADGVGEGELFSAARLEVSPDGKLSYHTLSPLPARVLRIQAS